MYPQDTHIFIFQFKKACRYVSGNSLLLSV